MVIKLHTNLLLTNTSMCAPETSFLQCKKLSILSLRGNRTT